MNLQVFVNCLNSIKALDTEGRFEDKSDLLIMEGSWCDAMGACFVNLITSYNKVTGSGLKVTINGELWDLPNFDENQISSPVTPIISWKINLNKKRLLQSLPNLGGSDIASLLFITLDSFTKWCETSDFLSSPLTSTTIDDKPLKIVVSGLNICFGGPNLAILPLETNGVVPSDVSWLGGSYLPKEKRVKDLVHILSSEAIHLRPLRYQLSWGKIDSDAAASFRRASAIVLWACLCQTLEDDKRISFRGSRHINLSMCDLSPPIAVGNKELKVLEDAVAWCFTPISDSQGEIKGDEDTRISLLVDRLTLDLVESKSLLQSGFELLPSALKEARTRYRYVILDRKNDYNDELGKLHDDIAKLTEKYADKNEQLLDGLLKGLLTISLLIFIRALSKNNLIDSHSTIVLFKFFGIYMWTALALRLWKGNDDITLTSNHINQWSEVTREHMSKDEIEEVFVRGLSETKKKYWAKVIVISTIQIFLGFILFEASIFLRLFGL